jgi:hypothetical protein
MARLTLESPGLDKAAVNVARGYRKPAEWSLRTLEQQELWLMLAYYNALRKGGKLLTKEAAWLEALRDGFCSRSEWSSMPTECGFKWAKNSSATAQAALAGGGDVKAAAGGTANAKEKAAMRSGACAPLAVAWNLPDT